MLRSLKEISGFRIHATDGDIGNVDDFFFEDNTWHVRYIVVDTGRWLPGRRVLISPVAFGAPDWKAHKLPTVMDKQKVKESPDIDTDRPVSRQQEMDLHAYYMWPPYWGADFGVVGAYPFPTGMPEAEETEALKAAAPHGDPHLRSVREVLDYSVEGLDGDVGDVEDFIIDDTNWQIRYMVLDTGNWLPGKKALVETRWIHGIDWDEEVVHVDLHKEAIQTCPEFDPDQPIGEQYEKAVKSHYSQAR